MWQSSWKADLCLSVSKLMFKSTNAHLQLLLFYLHLLYCHAHTHTLMASELLQQGIAEMKSRKFSIHLFVKYL